MSNFPATSIDSFTTWQDAINYPTAAQLNDLQSGLVATETKVGINSSADTNSLDYKIANMWATIYPVGAVYFSYVSTSPATLFGGTWSAITGGKFIVTYDSGDADFNAAGDTGGEKTHALTEAELATHTHTQNAHAHTIPGASSGGNDQYPINTGTTSGPGAGANYASFDATATNQNTGSGTAHNNLPPWLTLYAWRRTG